jgi:hypothetical protein
VRLQLRRGSLNQRRLERLLATLLAAFVLLTVFVTAISFGSPVKLVMSFLELHGQIGGWVGRWGASINVCWMVRAGFTRQGMAPSLSHITLTHCPCIGMPARMRICMPPAGSWLQMLGNSTIQAQYFFFQAQLLRLFVLVPVELLFPALKLRDILSLLLACLGLALAVPLLLWALLVRPLRLLMRDTDSAGEWGDVGSCWVGHALDQAGAPLVHSSCCQPRPHRGGHVLLPLPRGLARPILWLRLRHLPIPAAGGGIARHLASLLWWPFAFGSGVLRSWHEDICGKPCQPCLYPPLMFAWGIPLAAGGPAEQSAQPSRRPSRAVAAA